MTEPAKKTIFISIVADWAFEPEEIFPDGVPAHLTAADVAEAVKESRSAYSFLSDWDLGPVVVDISTGPGDYAQVELR